MSATTVATGTAVRAKARSVTVVANELFDIGLRITSHYGLASGSLTEQLNVVLTGLRVWLAAKQLASFVIEVFGESGQLLRKWELPVDYDEADQDEEHYETRLEELEEFLARDRPAGVAKYRVITRFRTDDHVPVPGWIKASLSDDSHLTRQQVSTRIVGTKHLQVAVFVYGDPPTQSGEVQ